MNTRPHLEKCVAVLQTAGEASASCTGARAGYGYALAFLTLLGGCEPTPPATQSPTTWTNPQTQAVVHLPDGWRPSAALAAKGATTIGYFKPRLQQVLAAAYTHVTFHREGAAEVGFEEFVGNFIQTMAAWKGRTDDPVWGQTDGFDTAQVQAIVPHGKRRQRLVVRFWTADEREYWYTITEAPYEDSLTVRQAEVLIRRLEQSTRRDAGAPGSP